MVLFVWDTSDIQHYYHRLVSVNANEVSHTGPPQLYGRLKGLGHAILGNFSTDQMVIELTKI